MIEDENWSPSQIAGVPKREGIHIAKQTVYDHVHADTIEKLASHIPHRLKCMKRSKALHPTRATNILNRMSIHQRPMQADSTRFGDWELDTIVDSYGHAIVTLTERSTNYILVKRLPQGREALPTAKTVAELFFPYRESLLIITTGNEYEFAACKEITGRLSMNGRSPVVVYFTDSYSSWQKGAVENTNRLIREYIPKKASFNSFSDQKIMEVQRKIDRRPRKRLNFGTPKYRFFESLP